MGKVDKQIMCVRCQQPKRFVGTYHFREDKNLLDLFSRSGSGLLNKTATFDVYACPRCGGVELFVNGVGEELRDEK